MQEQVKARVGLKDENGENTGETADCEVSYDFGDDLESAVAKCGEDVVFSKFRAAARVDLQGLMRGRLTAGQSQEEIQAFIDTWIPGMATERVAVNPEKALLGAWDSYSDEKKAEILAKLGVEI